MLVAKSTKTVLEWWQKQAKISGWLRCVWREWRRWIFNLAGVGRADVAIRYFWDFSRHRDIKAFIGPVRRGRTALVALIDSWQAALLRYFSRWSAVGQLVLPLLSQKSPRFRDLVLISLLFPEALWGLAAHPGDSDVWHRLYFVIRSSAP